MLFDACWSSDLQCFCGERVWHHLDADQNHEGSCLWVLIEFTHESLSRHLNYLQVFYSLQSRYRIVCPAVILDHLIIFTNIFDLLAIPNSLLPEARVLEECSSFLRLMQFSWCLPCFCIGASHTYWGINGRHIDLMLLDEGFVSDLGCYQRFNQDQSLTLTALL